MAISPQCRNSRHSVCTTDPDECDCECHDDQPARGIHDATAERSAAVTGRDDRTISIGESRVSVDGELHCPRGCYTPKPLMSEQAVRVHWSRTHTGKPFPGFSTVKHPPKPATSPRSEGEPDMPTAAETEFQHALGEVPEWMQDCMTVARAVAFLDDSDPFDALRDVFVAWAAEKRKDPDVALLIGVLNKRAK